MVKIILLAILCVLTFVSCRENKKNVSDAEVKNTYSWTSSEGDMMHSASVTLLEDGTFEFVFRLCQATSDAETTLYKTTS